MPHDTCPHGPDCDPSVELVDPGDPWTTHRVCPTHDQDHTDHLTERRAA